MGTQKRLRVALRTEFPQNRKCLQRQWRFCLRRLRQMPVFRPVLQ